HEHALADQPPGALRPLGDADHAHEDVVGTLVQRITAAEPRCQGALPRHHRQLRSGRSSAPTDVVSGTIVTYRSSTDNTRGEPGGPGGPGGPSSGPVARPSPRIRRSSSASGRSVGSTVRPGRT